MALVTLHTTKKNWLIFGTVEVPPTSGRSQILNRKYAAVPYLNYKHLGLDW